MGIIKLELKEFFEAENIFSELINSYPGSDILNFYKGYSNYHLALKTRSKNTYFTNNIQREQFVFELQTYFIKTRNAFMESIKVNNRFEQSHIYLANVYNLLGQTGNAMEHYNMALEINPKSTDALFYLGSFYSARRDFDMALKLFQNALRIKPKSQLMLTETAYLYFETGDYMFALEIAEDLLALNPQHIDAYFIRGNCYFKMDEPETAKENWDKCILLDGNYFKAFTNLRLYHLQKNELKKHMIG